MGVFGDAHIFRFRLLARTGLAEVPDGRMCASPHGGNMETNTLREGPNPSSRTLRDPPEGCQPSGGWADGTPARRACGAGILPASVRAFAGPILLACLVAAFARMRADLSATRRPDTGISGRSSRGDGGHVRTAFLRREGGVPETRTFCGFVSGPDQAWPKCRTGECARLRLAARRRQARSARAAGNVPKAPSLREVGSSPRAAGRTLRLAQRDTAQSARTSRRTTSASAIETKA